VREALFNIIGNIKEAKVLDCFAGSGVMAVEAISRGACEVVSIEQQRRAVRNMYHLSSQWEIGDRWNILHHDVAQILPALANSHYSLIFADPPYHSDWPQRLPQLLIHYHISADHIVIEEASDTNVVWPLQVSHISSRRYGESTLHFLQLKEPTSS